MTKLALRMVEAKRSLKQQILNKLVTKFPGKSTLNVRAMGTYGIPFCLILAIIYSLLSSPADTSSLSRSTERIGERFSNTTHTQKTQDSVKGLSKSPSPPEAREREKITRAARQTNINYRAKQVIERADASDAHNTLPTGTQFIGRLATAIDTREVGGIVKVALPYGSSAQGSELLPKDCVLFGTIKYDGNGEKVFLDIQSGAQPDGHEFKIRAQALSARDFSPGIVGDFHGTFSNRVAANLGLNFVSGLTETLIEKESAGNGSAFAPSTTAPKPTLKNGLLSGVSKVSDQEAQRVARELSSKQPFVTVESGKELIISLLERFVKPR